MSAPDTTERCATCGKPLCSCPDHNWKSPDLRDPKRAGATGVSLPCAGRAPISERGR